MPGVSAILVKSTPDTTTDTSTNTAPRNRLLRAADAWGGSVAATIVLTQAMAFGVALYSPYVDAPALGALAGLLAVVWLSLCSALSGGTMGMVSGPTGPSLVLLTAIAANLARSGLQGVAVIQTLGIVVVLCGAFQLLIGVTGGGRIIKLIPVSVVAGFMTGSGILMILSQSGAVTAGAIHTGRWSHAWIPLLTTAVTLYTTIAAPRWIRGVPGTIVGLLVGTLTFHLLSAAASFSPPSDWMVGVLPGLHRLLYLTPTTLSWHLPWGVILVSAVALAVFTSLDTLLTAVISDAETATRHDARRELAGQGVGHMISGALGGMAGAGTTAATVLAVRSGGRRFSGAWCAAVIVILVLFFDNVTAWIPLSVLAGIVIQVAIGLFETDIVNWWRRPRLRSDALVAILVTTVTVAYDLMLAVVVGVIITAIEYLADQVSTPVVLRRTTARTSRSQRVRTPEEQAALDEHGDRVVFYELRRSLFFATADRLYEEIQPDLERGCHLVISLRRVSRVDLTGMKLLQQMAGRAHAAGGEVVFANVHKHTGLGRNVRKTLRRAGFDRRELKIRTFKSSDVALEQAEDQLLRELGVRATADDRVVELNDTELCREMSDSQVEVLRTYLKSHHAADHEFIYRAGEPGGVMYAIRRGNVDIRLATGRKHYSRLARMGPGMLFGEASFRTPGAHTATAVATEPCELFELHREDFERLAKEHPVLAMAILDMLGSLLGRRLRQANREIYLLNQF